MTQPWKIRRGKHSPCHTNILARRHAFDTAATPSVQPHGMRHAACDKFVSPPGPGMPLRHDVCICPGCCLFACASFAAKSPKLEGCKTLNLYVQAKTGLARHPHPLRSMWCKQPKVTKEEECVLLSVNGLLCTGTGVWLQCCHACGAFCLLASLAVGVEAGVMQCVVGTCEVVCWCI